VVLDGEGMRTANAADSKIYRDGDAWLRMLFARLAAAENISLFLRW